MGAKSAIMIHYPRAAACSYTEERRNSRRAQVQKELNMMHYPRAAACLFTRLRAEESSDFIQPETLCEVPSHEKPYEIVVYLYVCVFLFIYDILEYVYPSACDKKFNIQLDPYLVQRKYIFRIYISKLIATQSSSPYKVVLASTSMVIVIV